MGPKPLFLLEFERQLLRPLGHEGRLRNFSCFLKKIVQIKKKIFVTDVIVKKAF